MKKILISLNMTYSFSRELWSGIVRYSYENNRWAMFLANTESLSDEELAEYDGTIGMFVTEDEYNRVRSKQKYAINVSNRGFKIPSVINDDIRVGEAAANYLVNKGYRHFGFLGDNTHISSCRLEGYEKELIKNNKTCTKLINATDAELRQWIKEAPISTAILCTDDYFAFRIIRNCWVANIPVPQHLAVLGVNNDETYCLTSSVGISSVMLSSEKIGYMAAEYLDKLFEEKTFEDQILTVPPLSVISRISTDMQSIQDELVRKALRYIQENLHRSIRVDDLLDYLSVSRRTLERRFKEKLGHSPHFAINRARVEVAKNLLEATNMKMEAIAEKCGFSEARILYRNFRIVAGVSPAKYRKNFR